MNVGLSMGVCASDQTFDMDIVPTSDPPPETASLAMLVPALGVCDISSGLVFTALTPLGVPVFEPIPVVRLDGLAPSSTSMLGTTSLTGVVTAISAITLISFFTSTNIESACSLDTDVFVPSPLSIGTGTSMQSVDVLSSSVLLVTVLAAAAAFSPDVLATGVAEETFGHSSS